MLAMPEHTLGNGHHDDEIRLVEVSRCGEFDLDKWIQVGMLVVCSNVSGV